jgi:hypothetical protein
VTKCWIVLVALVLAISMRPSRAVADPAPGEPEGFPHIAFLVSAEGLPTDSVLAHAFRSGFHDAFDHEFFLTERMPGKDGRRALSPALSNRFKLAQGDPFGDEWQLQVTVMGWWSVGVGVPAPGDTSGARPRGPGLRVNVTALSAAAAALGARPLPTREDLSLQVPLEPRVELFTEAGRTVGIVAIEALHHASGDLDEDARLRLPHASRRSLVSRSPSRPQR